MNAFIAFKSFCTVSSDEKVRTYLWFYLFVKNLIGERKKIIYIGKQINIDGSRFFNACYIRIYSRNAFIAFYSFFTVRSDEKVRTSRNFITILRNFIIFGCTLRLDLIILSWKLPWNFFYFRLHLNLKCTFLPAFDELSPIYLKKKNVLRVFSIRKNLPPVAKCIYCTSIVRSTEYRHCTRLFLQVPNWDLPPLARRRVFPPLLVPGGGVTLSCSSRGGGPNSDDGTNTVVL